MRVPFVKSLVGSLHRSSFAHTSIEASGTLPTEANPRRALHPTARELHATLAMFAGHEMIVSACQEAESAKMKPPKAAHYLKITAIKMVSTTCP